MIWGNLECLLIGFGVEILIGVVKIEDNYIVFYGASGTVIGGRVTAKNIIIVIGFMLFVLLGIEVDYKMVFIFDVGLKFDWVLEWVVIIGFGYIGLEFFDVYIAFGFDVIFIEVMFNIMLGFDKEIVKMVECILIILCNIDYVINVLVIKVTSGISGEKSVTIEFIDFKTKEVVDIMEVDVVLVVIGCFLYIVGLNVESIGVEF